MNKTTEKTYPSSFSLKQYLKELIPIERYAFFETHTNLDEYEWKKLKQNEQIVLITSYVLDIKNLEKILIYAPEASMLIVIKLLNDIALDENDIKNGVDYLFDNLILNSICNFLSVDKLKEEPSDYFIFNDLMPLFRSLSISKLETKRQQILPIVSYIRPVMNFYGILEINELIKIYRSQNADEQSDVQLTKYIKDFVKYDGDIYMRKNEIMHECNFMLKDNYTFLLEHTQVKPLYIPPKNELMKYEDEDYFETNKSFLEFRSFIITHLHLDEYHLGEFLYGLRMKMNYGHPINQIPEIMINPAIDKMNEQTIKSFIAVSIRFYNNYRSWFNRGHTAEEI